MNNHEQCAVNRSQSQVESMLVLRHGQEIATGLHSDNSTPLAAGKGDLASVCNRRPHACIPRAMLAKSMETNKGRRG